MGDEDIVSCSRLVAISGSRLVARSCSRLVSRSRLRFDFGLRIEFLPLVDALLTSKNSRDRFSHRKATN